MSMLAIGITGLNAAQLGLVTTEHNIANANTEGYTRQRIIQSTNIPIATGAGFVGQGTHVETIQRMYDGFVAGQVAQSATRASELDAYLDEVKLIDNMLADPTSGLSPALQEFFRGVQQVAAEPASLPARQSMLSATETLVARYHSIESRLAEQYESLNEQLQSHVGLINSYASQIAELNQRIVISQAATGQPANDLLDQRDVVVSHLNEEIRVTAVSEADGSVNVFAGNGQQLVIGVQFNQLIAQPSVADPERFAIALVNPTNTQELPESILAGGVLGGLLRFRSESLEPAANSLGRLAASMAMTFNAQHALGQDLLGNVNDPSKPGFQPDYFTLSGPKVVANALNGTIVPATDLDAQFVTPPPVIYNNGDFQMSYDLATATYTVSSDRFGGSWSNTDLPTLLSTVAVATGEEIDLASGNYATNLTTSDYRVQFDAAGTSYTVTRLSDDAVVVPLTPIGAPGPLGDTRVFFDGLTLNVTNPATANASYTIQPTREVARNLALNISIAADPRLIAAASPVRAEVTQTNTGTGKIELLTVQDGFAWPNNTPPLTVSYDGTTNTLSFANVPAAAGANGAVTAGGTSTAFALPGPVAYTPDAVITIGGLSFRISGAPKNLDTFTVARNVNGVADSRNALLLGRLQTQDTMAGGKTSFQGAYGQLVSDVGNKTREVQVTGEAQKALLEQAIAAREAQSGVNLDEEAANLIRYQQAYQAAARVIDVGSRLFDVLIGIGA